MTSTEQLQRLMRIVEEKYPDQAKALIIWGDGSGSIRIACQGEHNQNALTGDSNLDDRIKLCGWLSSTMETHLLEYAQELVDDLGLDPSHDPFENLLRVLES